MNSVRNRLAWRLANCALRIGTPRYRKFVTGSVEYGLRSAARDELAGVDAPPDWRAPSVVLRRPSVTRTAVFDLNDCDQEDW